MLEKSSPVFLYCAEGTPAVYSSSIGKTDILGCGEKSLSDQQSPTFPGLLTSDNMYREVEGKKEGDSSSRESSEQEQDAEATPSPDMFTTPEDYSSRAREHRAFAFLTEEVTSRYTIGDLIGHGGGGAVYEGVRKEDNAQIAVKFVTVDEVCGMMTMPGTKCVLPVEVGLMELVSKPFHSPHVLGLLEWFAIPNYTVLILERPSPCMDLLDFCELYGGKLPEPLAQDIMRQVVKAARHCCDRGVFHNDIKLENILINVETMQVKLIDFGCGDLLQDTPYEYCPGTPDYHPPEWYRHRQYMGCSTTVWSLGIVLYQLLHGSLPFQTKEDIINGHLEFAPGLSEDCCKLISWCLNQDPTSRPSFKQILKQKWFRAGRSQVKRSHAIIHLAKRLLQRLQKRIKKYHF